MTRKDIVERIAAIKHALNGRVEVWHVVVKSDGTISRRIYRGSFSAPRAHQETRP